MGMARRDQVPAARQAKGRKDLNQRGPADNNEKTLQADIPRDWAQHFLVRQNTHMLKRGTMKYSWQVESALQRISDRQFYSDAFFHSLDV